MRRNGGCVHWERSGEGKHSGGLASSKQLKLGWRCDKLEGKHGVAGVKIDSSLVGIERNYSANISRDRSFHSWFLLLRSLQWHYVAIVIKLKLIENWLADDFRFDSFHLQVSCHKLFLRTEIWSYAYSTCEFPTMYLLILLDERLTICLFYECPTIYSSNLRVRLQTYSRTFVQIYSTCKYLTMCLLIPLLRSLTDLHYLRQTYLFYLLEVSTLWRVSTNQTLHLKHSQAPFFTRNLIIAALLILCSAGTIQMFTMRRTCAKV